MILIINMKTKGVMKVLAKIFSIIFIILFILDLYTAFTSETPDYFVLQSAATVFLRVFIFSPPLFYFAWSKEGKSRVFKIWGKIASIFILAILLIFIIIVGGASSKISLGILGASGFLVDLFFMVFIGYFSWFDKDKKKVKKKKNP